MLRIVLLGFLVFTVSVVVLPTPIYAISLDDDEEDAEDVADLLEQAKKAGKSESFSKANELLKKAKMYGVNKEDTQEASTYVAQKKQARDARLERERKEKERLARLKREKEERARQARLARQRERSQRYSGGSNVEYVQVQAECIAGFSPCIEKNLKVSGSPGRFENGAFNSASHGTIYKGYNGLLRGTYRFQVQFDNSICSGSFYISGQKRNYSIRLGRDCHDNGSGEW